MTLEKPWDKAYRALLDELVKNWRGEISDPNESDKGGFLQASPGMFEYPRYFTKIGEYNLFVENSELPFLGATFMEADDNYEYLRISVSTDTDTNMYLAVRHEGFFDRFKKALRLEWEYQTGVKSFDERYFILADYRGHPERLCDPGVQQAIIALEPFDGVQINGKTVMWAIGIKSKKQLNFAYVQPVVEKLIALTKLVTV